MRLQIAAAGPKDAQLSYRAAIAYRLNLFSGSVLSAPPGFATSDRNGDGVRETFSDGVTDAHRLSEHVFDADGQLGGRIGSAQRISGRINFAQHIVSDASFLRNATRAGVPAGLDVNDLPPVPPGHLGRAALSLGLADRITPATFLILDLGVRFSLASEVGIGNAIASLLTPVAMVQLTPWKKSADESFILRLSYDTVARAPTLRERDAPPPFDGRGIAAHATLRYMAVRQAPAFARRSPRRLPRCPWCAGGPRSARQRRAVVGRDE